MENKNKMNLIGFRVVWLGMLVLFAAGCQSDIDVIKPDLKGENMLLLGLGDPETDGKDTGLATNSFLKTKNELSNVENYLTQATNQVKMEFDQAIKKRNDEILRLKKEGVGIIDIPRDSVQVYTYVMEGQTEHLKYITNRMDHYFNNLETTFKWITNQFHAIEKLGELPEGKQFERLSEDLRQDIGQLWSEIGQRTNAVLQLFYEFDHEERNLQLPGLPSEDASAFYIETNETMSRILGGNLHPVRIRDLRFVRGDFILTNININIVSNFVSNTIQRFNKKKALELKKNGILSQEGRAELTQILNDARQGLFPIIAKIITEFSKVQAEHASVEFDRTYLHINSEPQAVHGSVMFDRPYMQTNIETAVKINIITKGHYNQISQIYHDAVSRLEEARLPENRGRRDTPATNTEVNVFTRVINNLAQGVQEDALAVGGYPVTDDDSLVIPDPLESTYDTNAGNILGYMENEAVTNSIADFNAIIVENIRFFRVYDAFLDQVRSSATFRGESADSRQALLSDFEWRLSRVATNMEKAGVRWKNAPACRGTVFMARESIAHVLNTMERISLLLQDETSPSSYRQDQTELIESMLTVMRSSLSRFAFSHVRPRISLRALELVLENYTYHPYPGAPTHRYYNSGLVCPVVHSEVIAEDIEYLMEDGRSRSHVRLFVQINSADLSDISELIDYYINTYRQTQGAILRAEGMESSHGAERPFEINASADFNSRIQLYELARDYWRSGNQCTLRRAIFREAIGQLVRGLSTVQYYYGPSADSLPVITERRVLMEMLEKFQELVLMHRVSQLVGDRVRFSNFHAASSFLINYLELYRDNNVCTVSDAVGFFQYEGLNSAALTLLDESVEEIDRYDSVLTNEAARDRMFIEGTSYRTVIEESVEEAVEEIDIFLSSYDQFHDFIRTHIIENEHVNFATVDNFDRITNVYRRTVNYWQQEDNRVCPVTGVLINEAIRHMVVAMRDIEPIMPITTNRHLSRIIMDVRNAVHVVTQLPISQDVPLTSLDNYEMTLSEAERRPVACPGTDSSDSDSLPLSEFDDMDTYERIVGGASVDIIREYPDIYALGDYIDITTNMSNFLGIYDQLRSFLRTLTPSDVAGDPRLNNILTNMGELDEARTFYSDAQSPWFRGPECLGSAYLYRESIGHILRIISRFDYSRRGQGSGGRYETLDHVLLSGERLLNGHVLSQLRPYHSLERSVDLQNEYELLERGFHRSFPCRERRTIPENFLQAMQGDADPDNFFTNQGVIEELVERINTTISMYHSAYLSLTGYSQQESDGGDRIDMSMASPPARDGIFELSLPDNFARIINNFANARDMARETWGHGGIPVPLAQCEYSRRILMQSIGHFVVMLQNLDYENISSFHVRDTDPRLISLRMLMNLRDQVLLYPLATYSSLHITLRLGHLETLLRGPGAECEASVPEDGDTGITGNLYGRDGQSPQDQNPPSKNDIKRSIPDSEGSEENPVVDEVISLVEDEAGSDNNETNTGNNGGYTVPNDGSEENPVVDEVISTVIPFFGGVISLVEDEAGSDNNETNTDNNGGYAAPNDGSTGTEGVAPDESGEQSSSDSASSEENPVVDGVISLVTGEEEPVDEGYAFPGEGGAVTGEVNIVPDQDITVNGDGFSLGDIFIYQNVTDPETGKSTPVIKKTSKSRLNHK